MSACITTIMAMFSCIAYFIIQGIRDKVLLEIGEYNEVVHEWATVPFSEIAIVTGTRSCPLTHPALVVYDIWPGLDIACYCQRSAKYTSTYGNTCNE